MVQRYLTTSTEQQAQKAVWTNVFLSIPATILFALMGIALFVFYKVNPDLLGPLDKNDQILPWFVAHEMPAGLAGLVIAGVFAAAMSSLDSSMHSICTAISNDFVKAIQVRLGRSSSTQLCPYPSRLSWNCGYNYRLSDVHP